MCLSLWTRTWLEIPIPKRIQICTLTLSEGAAGGVCNVRVVRLWLGQWNPIGVSACLAAVCSFSPSPDPNLGQLVNWQRLTYCCSTTSPSQIHTHTHTLHEEINGSWKKKKTETSLKFTLSTYCLPGGHLRGEGGWGYRVKGRWSPADLDFASRRILLQVSLGDLCHQLLVKLCRVGHAEARPKVIHKPAEDVPEQLLITHCLWHIYSEY